MDLQPDPTPKPPPRRGGRPAKPPGERAEAHFTVWVTAAEHDRIYAAYRLQTTGSRITLSRYLKDRLLRDRPAPAISDTRTLREYYVALEEIAHLLTGISGNVNQAVKRIHCTPDGTGLSPAFDETSRRLAGLPALMGRLSDNLTWLSDHLYGTGSADSDADADKNSTGTTGPTRPDRW